MKTFIDSQFVVARINNKDEHHERAVQLARQYDGKELVTTDAILLEVGNALARQHRLEAIAVIDNFQTSPEIEIVRLDPEIFEQAFDLFKSHSDKTWGLVDCVSFVVMRQHEISDVLTYDQHFVQAGFSALLREAGV